ncbi:MAG TPA: polynucleotide adenylyltransferase PcnB [Marinagarivorans sp.]
MARIGSAAFTGPRRDSSPTDNPWYTRASLSDSPHIMLKRLFKLLSSSPSSSQATITRQEHPIELKQLSPAATKVCSQLQQAGYQAYIVGGGIRDSLLQTKPKDFDVATSATPEQVRQVFRNARIIGRRFKIVHVRFGREVIEVTTFRGHHEQGKAREAVQSEQGLLLRDNVYGDIESDAIRRDFTINALYYDPTTQTLIDFTQGLRDIESRTLRIIGDPSERYREDPVRMLRAARFAAKLGFDLAPSTAEPIYQLGELLDHIPSARLFEEVLKLMLGGCATATFTSLEKYDLLRHLFPGVSPLVDASAFNRKLIDLVCVNTDKRIRQGKRVTPAFIFAAFLWLPLQAQIRHLTQNGTKIGEAKNTAISGVIAQQLVRTAIPKRFLIPMRDIWFLQHGLERRPGKRCFATLEHQRFRAAYDFLLLREDAGENHNGAGTWWTEFQHADEARQQELLESLGQQSPQNGDPASESKRRPRRRRPRKAPPKE